MNNKSILSLIILLLCCSMAKAQDPVTLNIKYGAVEGGITIESPISSKDWDGNELASFLENFYIIENQSDIDPNDDVRLNIVMKYEYKDDQGNWIPMSEPGIVYSIWSYVTLEGEDAYKYKLGINQYVKTSHEERYLSIDATYTEGLRMMEAETAEIAAIEVTITPPTGTYTYGASEIGKDIKPTIDNEQPGYFDFLVNQASGSIRILIGEMLGVGENLLQIWYRFEESTHYKAESVETTITVEPKIIDYQGEIVIKAKPKDGNTNLISQQIKTLPTLQGVLEDDDVQLSVDFDKTKYPSAEPGEYNINVYLKLTGKQAANYTLSKTVEQATAEISSSGKIIAELGGDFTIEPKYFDNTDKIYEGEVIPPAISNLIDNDDVKIVVDYEKTKFPESTVGQHLVRVYYKLGGDDAFRYDLKQTSKMEYGEITDFEMEINATPDSKGVYQLVYTQSQLGEDLKIKNQRNEYETSKYFIEGVDVTKKMLTSGTYTVKAIMYQYQNQVAECEWKVNVNKLKLKVSEPQILHTKVYDGTTTVPLTGSNCELTNKLATDDVEISSQTQVFDSPDVGSGKKITVSFVLSGDITNKYIAPDNIVYNDGVISPGKIEITNISEAKTSYCQGDEAKIILKISNGVPQSAHIAFDNDAKQNGFADLDINNLTTESADEKSFTIAIPSDAGAGKYKAEITLSDPLGTVSEKYKFEISINYPKSYIKSMFSDVVFIDNAEEQFVEYQWYKDGKKLDGETMQFYNDQNGVNGIYSAEITTTKGDKLKVCETQLNTTTVSTTKSLAKSADIYPNPAKALQPINIKLVNFADNDINEAQLFIFNSLGNKVLQRENLTEEFTISLPKGSYTATIIFNQHKLSYKIIVNN